MKLVYRVLILIFACTNIYLLSSCMTGQKLVVDHVAYQSIRNTRNDLQKEPPSYAKIKVEFLIKPNGQLSVFVTNLTDRIMTVDQTKSFFVNTNGRSVSYYDPTIRTSSTTEIETKGSGIGVNLGAIGGALGIGGKVGQILNGMNVSGSKSKGESTTNSTITIEQPQVSIAPRGQIELAHTYTIDGVGKDAMKQVQPGTIMSQGHILDFSVTVSYQLEGESRLNKIVSNMYVSSMFNCPVSNKGKVNDALRTVLSNKTDALIEPWYFFHFNDNLDAEETVNIWLTNRLYDYQ